MNSFETEDRVLITQTLNGDSLAFEKLILKYQDRIFNMLFRYLNSYEDAEDVTQEAFIKAYRSLDKFELKASFLTWIYRIAINTAKSRFRRKSEKLSAKCVSIHPNESDEGGIDVVADDKTPLQKMEDEEAYNAVQDAIGQLDEEHRMVIVLRDIEGYDYQEIVEIMDINLGTVKSRLHRVRSRLAQMLQEKV